MNSINSINNQFLTALILAGGASSRMGFDKTLLEIKGHSLLENLCLAAATITNRVYIITPWPKRYQAIVPSDCHFIREIVPPGESKPQGPLFGFVQGLAQVETEWVLLLACDLPFLTAPELKMWVSYLSRLGRENYIAFTSQPLKAGKEREIGNNLVFDGQSTLLFPKDIIAFLPRGVKGWEPLAGFYRRSALPLLEDFIALGGKSFQAWLGQHRVEELPITNSNVLFNCNTPQDFQKIRT